MAAPRKYGDELRERATRMTVEARQDPATRAGAIKRVADQLGMHPETLRNWVRLQIPFTTYPPAGRAPEMGDQKPTEKCGKRRPSVRRRTSSRPRTTPSSKPPPTAGTERLPEEHPGPYLDATLAQMIPMSAKTRPRAFVY